MITTERTVFLSILTILIYAIGIYAQPGGQLVFPFPLYPIFMFIVALTYLLKHRSDINSWLLLTGASLILLSSAFIWEIVLSVEKFQAFLEKPIIDLFYLIGKLALIAFVFTGLIIKKEKKATIVLFATISSALLLIGLIFSERIFEAIGFGIAAYGAGYFKDNLAFISVLLFSSFLALTEWLTFTLNNF